MREKERRKKKEERERKRKTNTRERGATSPPLILDKKEYFWNKNLEIFGCFGQSPDFLVFQSLNFFLKKRDKKTKEGRIRFGDFIFK